MFLRKVYEMLTGDATAARTTDEEEINKRISEMLELQDPELTVDLRIDNKGQLEKYNVFLEECKKYLNEKVGTAVEDRGHDTIVVYGTYAIKCQNIVRMEHLFRRFSGCTYNFGHKDVTQKLWSDIMVA